VILYASEKIIQIERFGEVALGANLLCPGPRILRGSNYDQGGAMIELLPETTRKFPPVHHWHLHVQEYYAWHLSTDLL
jgi:hypothetical protein